jgi:hypothetical protein
LNPLYFREDADPLALARSLLDERRRAPVDMRFRKEPWILFLIAAGFLLGCSADRGTPDAGTDSSDASLAGDGNEVGSAEGHEDGDGVDGGVPDGDHAGEGGDLLEGELELVIPEGSRRCRFARDHDAPEVLANKGRVWFSAGSVRFRRDQEEFSSGLELVEKVELAPDGREPRSLGPGVFQRTVIADEPNAREIYRYDYEQRFEDGDELLQVIIRVDFYAVDGEIEERVKVFEDVFVLLAHPPSSAYLIEGCPPDVAEGETRCAANGDRIVLGTSCSVAAPSCDLVWARFVRGGQERTVDDFFRLATGFHHHFFSRSYRVVFSEPIDSIEIVDIPPVTVDGGVEEIVYSTGERHVLVPCEK